MPSLADHQSNEFIKLTVEEVAIHYNRPIVVNEEGCWLWLGATDRRGYARFGGTTLVHGAVWRMAGFECIGDVELCHKCANRNCINPDHLYVGTHWQNMQDAAAAGVMGVRGRVPQEKLEEARKMLAEGVMKKDVAAYLGVSRPWITRFINEGYKYAKLSRTSEQ